MHSGSLVKIKGGPPTHYKTDLLRAVCTYDGVYDSEYDCVHDYSAATSIKTFLVMDGHFWEAFLTKAVYEQVRVSNLFLGIAAGLVKSAQGEGRPSLARGLMYVVWPETDRQLRWRFFYALQNELCRAMF
jgi:hypothetical protein